MFNKSVNIFLYVKAYQIDKFSIRYTHVGPCASGYFTFTSLCM